MLITKSHNEKFYSYPENGEGNRLTSLTTEKESQKTEKSTKTNYQYNKSGSPKQSKGFTYEYNANQRPVRVIGDSHQR